MRDTAVVLEVTEKTALVKPLITGACISCTNTACAKQGKPFSADIPETIQLQKGDFVQLGASPAAQARQALLALFLPIMAAVSGYLLAPKNETAQSIICISAFFVTALAVLLVTRLFPPAKSEIIKKEPASFEADPSSTTDCLNRKGQSY